MVGVGAFLASAAKPRAPMFSIQHRSAMKAFSLGRCSSVIISTPGASQSMSASAHWRSLIFASMASMSIFVWGAIFNLLRRHAISEADGAGVHRRSETLGAPADPGVGLRHAVKAAAVIGVEAHPGDPLRREAGP